MIVLWAVHPGPARASDVCGTVNFQGQTTFAAPIAGIDPSDLEVGADTETEATGNGEHRSVLATVSDDASLTGAYPSSGQVSADLLVERGGPQVPDGECIITVRASGTDGVSTSAHGFQTLFVTVADIMAAATLRVPDIVVRESKAVSSVAVACKKWVKKQIKLRAECNITLLRTGAAGADAC